MPDPGQRYGATLHRSPYYEEETMRERLDREQQELHDTVQELKRVFGAAPLMPRREL